ncbi:leucine-rich repeat domain-containing protein [Sorangium sp. So ce281]|uniref:leucine-rich repeat domain-containing protein n=1 Tax=unclassified Sorangium TaxID=2621164 RepID=UPI003F618B6C
MGNGLRFFRKELRSADRWRTVRPPEKGILDERARRVSPRAGGHDVRHLAADREIHSLSGIECIRSLTQLDVIGNRLADLSPLRSLTELRSLTARRNPITNVAPLRSLIRLYDAEISDTSPLSTLTELRLLFLGRNRISDLSPLASLPSLSIFDISDSLVSDLTPLVANPDFGQSGMVGLRRNPIDCAAQASNLAALRARGAHVLSDCP